VRIPHLPFRQPAKRISGYRCEVLTGADHLAHLVFEFDKERYDLPLTPSECHKLAALLLGAAQQVNGAERIAKLVEA
jgi:hypothetical protein